MGGTVVAIGLVDAEEAGIVSDGALFAGVADDSGDGEFSLKNLFESAHAKEGVKGLGVGENEDAIFSTRSFDEEVFDGFYDGGIESKIC